MIMGDDNRDVVARLCTGININNLIYSTEEYLLFSKITYNSKMEYK